MELMSIDSVFQIMAASAIAGMGFEILLSSLSYFIASLFHHFAV